MAAASADNTGPSPQAGTISYKSTSRGVVNWSTSRRLTHYLSNNPTQKELWAGESLDYADGFHIIPDNCMRSAFTPNMWRELKYKHPAVRFEGFGFRVLYSNVQEQTARRFGDQTQIQSVDANMPNFWVINNNRWLDHKRLMTEPETSPYNVNDNMKNPRPETFDEGLLKTVGWRMSQKWWDSIPDDQKASIDGRSVPPFNLEKMMSNYGPSLVGWGTTHRIPDPGFIATAPYDTELLSALEQQLMDDPTYYMPDALPFEPYAREFANVSIEKNSRRVKYPDSLVRLDRVNTRGGDLVRDAEIQVEYFAFGSAVTNADHSYFNHTSPAGWIPNADPWLQQFRKLWSSVTPDMLMLYNARFTFINIPGELEKHLETFEGEGVQGAIEPPKKKAKTSNPEEAPGVQQPQRTTEG